MAKRTLSKYARFWSKIAIVLSLLVVMPVFAAVQKDPEQNKPNGIKAGFEKAKTKISEMMKGAPKEAPKQISKETPAPAVAPVNLQDGKHHIRLKNGYDLNGVITERDNNGVWVKMDSGGKIYVSNHALAENG